MCTSDGIDQLPGDAYPVSALSHRAFEHIPDAQIAPDLFHIDGTALVGERRVAGDHEEPFDPGESGDDLFDHAVGKIFLLWIPAHILERKHCDRRLVGKRQRLVVKHRGQPRPRLYGDGTVPNPVHTYWPSDVLDAPLAQILESKVQLVADLVIHCPGNTNPARLSERFEASRNIDAVAEDVVFLDDHVAQIDPDAEPDPALLGHVRLTVDHPSLDLYGAAHRVDHARELCQEAVAGILDSAAAMLGDLRIDHFPEVGPETLVRPLLIVSHQPRVSRHISGEDRGETAGRGHGS